MRRLVILRPEPGASATLARAEAAGLDALTIPLFEVRPIDWQPPEPGAHDVVLLTSANAIRHGGAGLEHLKSLPAYCVGETTAEAARDAGFEIAWAGVRDGSAVVVHIPAGQRVLHIAGRDHRDLAKSVIPVYESGAIDPPPALEALPGAVAMVHSPRAGARLSELVRARGDTSIIAISQAAADACGEGWREIAVADRPDDSAMLAAAAALCHNLPQ